MPDLAAAAVLDVKGVSKAFDGLVALSNVSFSVRAGRIHGLIGPNGAGKTTLFNVITAIMPPSSGTVLFEARDITRISPHGVARLGIARTFQNVRLFRNQTALENVMVGTFRHTKAGMMSGLLRLPRAVAEQRRIETEALECLDYVGLADLIDRDAEALPFGQQRLLELARALALRPKLLLLDEPAAGLNDRETEKLGELIRSLPARGITVLLVEHNMALMMSVADSIVVLNYGVKIAEGTSDEIAANGEVIRAYLGDEDIG